MFKLIGDQKGETEKLLGKWKKCIKKLSETNSAVLTVNSLLLTDNLDET